MSTITFRARNFRGLHKFEWSPTGVCLLCGPNGAGKTTALDILKFLRGLFTQGIDAGFAAVKGGDHFPTRGSGADDLVEFEVVVDEIRWVVRLPMSNAGLRSYYGEELYRGEDLILRAAPFSETWFLGKQAMSLDDESRCCTKVLWDRGESRWLEPLVNALTNIRVYDFWLNQVADGTTREDRATFLHGTGKNLWAVLANWRGAPTRHRGQFEYVLSHARSAFPDLIAALEFEGSEAYVFPPGATDPADGLPPRRQAEGLLTGLLQLTAIAGAKSGSILAFDEMENQLHPHAIRSILQAMRQRAEAMDLTVILTTHSPVLMNEFGDHPDQLYVLDRAASVNPVALDQLKNPEWLAMFALGDLYDRERFAAPPSRPASIDAEGEE